MAFISTLFEMIKIQLRIRLEEVNHSHLTKIAIESPETLSEKNKLVVNVWNRMPRRKKNCCCIDLLMK